MSKKRQFIDDGHTVYNMDVDGMPHRRIKNKDGINLTKKERKAVIIAALAHYLPYVIGAIVCFGLAMILLYFWLQ